MAHDSTPLIWRMRNRLQDFFAAMAILVVGLGLLLTGAAIFRGPIEGIAPGLSLVVGGALLMVMRRRK